MRTLDTCLLYLQQKKANFKALTCLVLFLYFIPLSNYACDQPSGSSNSNCGPGSVELTASGSTPFFNWYDAPSNGTLLWSGSTFNTPHLLATDTFYVSGVDTTTS